MLPFHICYNHLRDALKKTKEGYFAEFLEILKYINPNILDDYFSQLFSFGYSIRVNIIKKYLNYAKDNSSKFVKTLNKAIS